MFFVRLLVAILLIGVATKSWSQDVDDSPDRYRQDVAGARPQPGYDPLGVRIGAFVARGDGNFDIGYNSNIFGRAQSVVGDSYAKISPSLQLTSDWGRHGVSVSADGELTRYFARRDQDSDDYHIQAASHFELGDLVRLRSSIEYAREAEPRGSAGNRFTNGEPPYLNRFSYNLSSRILGQKMAAETLFVLRGFRYDPVRIDGIDVSQRFRASNGVGGRVALLYEVAPAVAALVQVVGDISWNPYREFCCLRNSHGFAVLGGVRLDNSGLIAGQATLGYRQRNFEGTKTASRGLTYDARIEWYPTELVTVKISAEQRYQNSGIAASDAVLIGRQSVGVDYELLRNLLVNIGAEHETDSYRQVVTRSDLKSVSFKATYTPRRMLQYAVNAKFRINDTNRQTVVSGFHGFEGSLSVRLRL